MKVRKHGRTTGYPEGTIAMSLEDTKSRISTKYLGKAGIHGIGMSRARNAVHIHLSDDPSTSSAASRATILDALKQDAAPYDVLISVEERPLKLA